LNGTRQVWLAVALLLAVPHLAAGDGSTLVTTAPRPPLAAYQQPAESLPPPRPDNSSPLVPSPLPPGISYGPSSPAPELPPLFEPLPEPIQRSERWLQLDFPAAWLMFPQFTQRAAAPLQVGNLYATTAALPNAPLDFTAAPAFGVRLNLRSFGTVELGYRYLVSEGSALVGGIDPAGPALMRSRLDVQVMELTYARHEFQTHGRLMDLWDQDLRISDLQGPPEWTLSWDLGARVANVYYDAQAIGASVDRQVVNYFIGGGPKVGLTLTRPVPSWNLAFFSRLDLGAMMGTIRQQFSEAAVDIFGNPLGFGYAARQQVQTVPTLAAQFGVSGAARRMGHWQVGYQFEQWWAIADVAGSSGDLLTHSVFARWLWNY
jgi:hypothetical protein